MSRSYAVFYPVAIILFIFAFYVMGIYSGKDSTSRFIIAWIGVFVLGVGLSLVRSGDRKLAGLILLCHIVVGAVGVVVLNLLLRI